MIPQYDTNLNNPSDDHVFGMNKIAASLALLLLITLLVVFYLFNKNRELASQIDLPKTEEQDKIDYATDNIPNYDSASATVTETEASKVPTKPKTRESVVNPLLIQTGNSNFNNEEVEGSNLQTTSVEDKQIYLNSFDLNSLPKSNPEQKEQYLSQ